VPCRLLGFDADQVAQPVVVFQASDQGDPTPVGARDEVAGSARLAVEPEGPCRSEGRTPGRGSGGDGVRHAEAQPLPAMGARRGARSTRIEGYSAGRSIRVVLTVESHREAEVKRLLVIGWAWSGPRSSPVAPLARPRDERDPGPGAAGRPSRVASRIVGGDGASARRRFLVADGTGPHAVALGLGPAPARAPGAPRAARRSTGRAKSVRTASATIGSLAEPRDGSAAGFKGAWPWPRS